MNPGSSITFHPDSPDVDFRPEGDLGDAREERGAVRNAAARLGEQARDRVTSRLTAQKSRAADTLGGVAQALLVAGQHLQEQNQGNVTPYVERLAHQVERVSHFLEDTNVDEVASDVGQFARRHPGLFISGALVLGFIGARFLKSSQRHPELTYDAGYGGTDVGGYASARSYEGTDGIAGSTTGLAHANERTAGDFGSPASRPDTGLADRAGSYGARQEGASGLSTTGTPDLQRGAGDRSTDNLGTIGAPRTHTDLGVGTNRPGTPGSINDINR